MYRIGRKRYKRGIVAFLIGVFLLNHLEFMVWATEHPAEIVHKSEVD